MNRSITHKPEIFGITEEWQRASQITNQPRHLKILVRQYNNEFGTDEAHQWYIVSGSYGYKITRNKDEIMHAINREKKAADDKYKQMKKRRNRAMEYFSINERLPI